MEFQDTILQGDVIDQLRKMPGDLVDCCFTSPPYWGLRDYGIAGQIGQEEHPKQYIEKIVEVFREVNRVLKPTGTLFLNLGDTYFSCGSPADRFGGSQHPEYSCLSKEQVINQGRGQGVPDGKWLQPKQKMLIPERVAIAMQEDGWILRNSIIWYKNNHMPESVGDRLTRSYETIFFFTKSQKYYFNLDAIRQVATTTPWTTTPGKYEANNPRANYTGKFDLTIAEAVGSPRARLATREKINFYNPKGKNPGDVWTVNTEPYKAAHFAVFPTKLVRLGLQCGCPKDGLVMDPFTGSGTTLYVARKMALHYLGIEIKPEYVELAKARLAKIPARLDTFFNPPDALAVALNGGKEITEVR